MIVENIFQGKSKIFGGVTDIEMLIKSCPKDFYKKNLWSNFVNIIIYRDCYDQNQWDWKSTDRNVQQKQFCYLSGLINAKISIENKLAITGWYLSNILKSVPEFKKKISN